MQRQVQERSDGLLFITLPRNSGYSKGEVVSIIKILSNNGLSDSDKRVEAPRHDKIPTAPQTLPTKTLSSSDGSNIPDLPYE